MFKWLSQRSENRKQKTKQLSETEIYISPMLKLLSQRLGGRGKPETKTLWEREFNIVKAGLDEKQVISFFNNLIAEQKASQEASATSLRSLPTTAVTDAEQIADSIEMKAQTEAEAEATTIISQAEQEAQEIKRRAERAAQKEAEDILSVANRRAEITEVEAKHKALLFLLRVREETEKEVRAEYERAYSRLSSSLQNLVSEGENIEAELKSKRAQLWESKTFELKQYEAGLLSTYKAAAAPSETSALAEIEVELDVASQKETKEPVQLQEEAIVSEPVGKATEEILEQHLPEEKPGREEDEAAPLELNSQALYAGEVEVEIATPVDPKMVYKLYDYLQTIPELKILHSRGSWDQGTVIAVVLEKPIPLVSLLSEMAGAEVTQSLPQKDSLVEGISSSLLGTKRKGTKRIRLTLKEPAP